MGFNLQNCKMRNLLLSLFFLLLVGVTKAETKETFKTHGKPLLTVFSNYHVGLTEDSNQAAFEVLRAFLGWEQYLTPNMSVEVKIDIGSPSEESTYDMVKRYAYLRNVALKYKSEKLIAQFGIIGMWHFKDQESFWGYRYIYKSFADEHKFGKSVDLGLRARYMFSKNIYADFCLVNGEGASQLQTNEEFQYCFGFGAKFKKVHARIYTNYAPTEDVDQMTYAAFLGYRFTKNFRLGGDLNFMQNYNGNKGYHQSGASIYSTYNISKKWNVFARYDIRRSNILEDDDSPWNIAKDGSAIISGVEYRYLPNLKFSVNYQDWKDYAANGDHEAYIYFNVGFKF